MKACPASFWASMVRISEDWSSRSSLAGRSLRAVQRHHQRRKLGA
jgi:hypothetical protein